MQVKVVTISAAHEEDVTLVFDATHSNDEIRAYIDLNVLDEVYEGLTIADCDVLINTQTVLRFTV